MSARVVTVNEVLGGHVKLDIECLDRVYLNAYVPILQSSGQVVAFMTQHLGLPIPSPALFDKIGQRFRRAVASFAETNDIPWVKFARDDRKADVMAPYLKRAAADGRSRVAAIGVAQEFQRVWTAYKRDTRTAAPQFTFAKADRRVTCYYFYLWDADFGPAFIKVCAYFPYPAKIWINGHEWAKRQAAQAGISFTELSNGFAACEDPAALQEICDRLQPGTVLAAYDAFYNHRGLWIQRSITLENITELKRDLGLELAATPTLTEERAAYYLHRLNKLIRSDRRAWVRLRTAEGPAAELTGEAEATSSP